MSKPITAIVLSLTLCGLPVAGQANGAAEVASVDRGSYVPEPAVSAPAEPPGIPRKALLTPEIESMQEALSRKIELQVQRSLASETAR